MIPWSRVTRAAELAREASLPELWFAARAWLLAPVVESALTAFGVATVVRTIGRIGRIEGPTLLCPSRRRVAVADGARWVDRAYALHWASGRCLPRAAVQHALHRMDGTPSYLVIGVRRGRTCGSELDAHAWVREGAPDAHGDFAEILVAGRDVVRTSTP